MNRQSTTSARTLQADPEKAVKEDYTAGLYSGEIVVNPEVLEEWKNMSPHDKKKFERKLLWKLDFRLIPWLSLLYLLSFLDRTNIGNAKIQGVKASNILLLTESVDYGLEHDEYPIQSVSDHLFHQLFGFRSPVQHPAEEIETAHLAHRNHGCMGNRNDIHGLCP